MKYTLTLLLIFKLFFHTPAVQANDFDYTVDNWESYQDVGEWLDKNFIFDKQRQETIRRRLQKQGPVGLLIRDPQKTLLNSSGYCADAAHFAREELNSIDPEYNAQWVFIKNEVGGPNHWVTGFYVDDKLYIMDYGTGPKWYAMKGTHGPYTSLEEYKDFLDSLNLPALDISKVYWRDMPGQTD